MMSHEFDAYLDMQPAEYFEPPYHEDLLLQQIQDELEMKAYHEANLKRQGAREALEAVYSKIAKLTWNNPSTSIGLWIAGREIKDQLQAIIAAEGGAL